MPSVNVTITAEALRRLRELAAAESRRPYVQAGWMLETLLLGHEPTALPGERKAKPPASVAKP